MVIMERSALSDNLKQSSLAQEVIRRMSNTLEHVTLVDRKRDTEADKYVTKEMVVEILDRFMDKLARSGYQVHKRQEIIKAGLTGYKRKLIRSLNENNGLKHASGAPGLEDRRIGRILDLSRWFRKVSKGDTRVSGDCQSGGQSRSSPVTVLFVPRTPGGELIRRLCQK